MKKGFVWAGVLAVSMVASGVTAYTVTKAADKDSYTPAESFASNVGTHFTAYEEGGYPDLTYAAENAVKGVVNIVNTQEISSRAGYRGGYGDDGGFEQFFDLFGIPRGQYRQQPEQQPRPQERKSGGSGVIISPDGYIVTNHHVVDNASKLKVTLNDKRTFDAKVIGTDPTTEVALIKIDATDLPTIPIGNSDALRLGEWVLAIGSPYGLQNTITAGIVSAKGRSLQALPTQYSLESFIQTDAAVNPGNSGGALVNTKGELVGINTLIQSQTGSYIGYSFAVPTSIVKKVVVDLKEYGVVQRAMLGIGYNAIDEAFLESDKGKSTGIKEQGGIYVGEVYPGSAAEAAGIKTGDIITEINGVKIEGSAQVSEEIAKHRPNDKITVSVKRGSDVKQIEVVLRNKTGNTDVITKDQVSAYDALNGEFAEVSEKALKSLKIKGGAIVTGVHEGGLLDKAGIRRGSVITRTNNSTISSVNDLNRITSAIESIEWINPDGTRDRLLIMPK